MLGWEFPPFITGGLGTACHGLTRAMDRAGMQTTFVLPKSVPGGSRRLLPSRAWSVPASEMGATLPEYERSRPTTTTARPPRRPSRAAPRSSASSRSFARSGSGSSTPRFVELPVEVQSVYREQEATWRRILEEYELDETAARDAHRSRRPSVTPP